MIGWMPEMLRRGLVTFSAQEMMMRMDYQEGNKILTCVVLMHALCKRAALQHTWGKRWQAMRRWFRFWDVHSDLLVVNLLLGYKIAHVSCIAVLRPSKNHNGSECKYNLVSKGRNTL